MLEKSHRHVFYNLIIVHVQAICQWEYIIFHIIHTFCTFCPQAFCQREHILVHCGKTLYLYRYECQVSTLASMIGQQQGAPVDVECRPVDLLLSPKNRRQSTDSMVTLHVIVCFGALRFGFRCRVLGGLI